MPTTRAAQFLETVTHNPDLRHQLEQAKTQDDRRKVMNAAGFSDVTKDELLSTIQANSTVKNVSSAEVNAVGELSDAELEAVAGGETTLWLSAVTVLAAATL
jgi:predicted ribosomally synthesized peptide with nif11-like leader